MLVADFELALVRATSMIEALARVWHPPQGASVVGRDLLFGGAGGTGLESISSTSGNLLVGDQSPSRVEEGDSGGGAFLALDLDLPASQPFATECATLVHGGPGDLVLVGVNQSFTTTEGQDGTDRFVSVTNPVVIEWIAKVTAADADGDHVCDGKDNCSLVPNDQSNCNRDAELSFSGNQLELGDACDPAPCPRPALEFREFQGGGVLVPVPGGAGDTVLVQLGREIDDDLTVTPVLEVGADPAGDVAPRFCQCAQPTALLCRGAPWFCDVHPRLIDKPEVGIQNVPEALDDDVPDQGQTRWHKVSLLGVVNGVTQPVLGATVHVNSYPGPKAKRRWAYEHDFDSWTALGWLFLAPPPNPLVPPGTDLRGVVWAHDDTQTGAAAHGLRCASA